MLSSTSKVSGTCSEELKVTLSEGLSFSQKNVEIIARRKLHELKHIGGIKDYGKKFLTMVLDILDIYKKDKILCFVDGLQPWARTLYEQKVQDLVT